MIDEDDKEKHFQQKMDLSDPTSQQKNNLDRDKTKGKVLGQIRSFESDTPLHTSQRRAKT